MEKDWDVYVIGGGPSLRHFDWGLLEGKRCVAVNHSWRFCRPHTLCWMDAIVYEQDPEALPDCRMIYRKNDRCKVLPEKGIEVNQFLKDAGFYNKIKGNDLRYSGELGVLIALNMARNKGKVYLLGFDAGEYEKLSDSYFHRAHEEIMENYEKTKANNKVHRNQVKRMNELQKIIDMSSVINLNPDSCYEGFKKVGIEEHFSLPPLC